jgi:hypothetical protein
MKPMARDQKTAIVFVTTLVLADPCLVREFLQYKNPRGAYTARTQQRFSVAPAESSSG